MSHVVEVGLKIKDLDALGEACKALGLELVRGQTSYKWFGRSVGDYPLPQGFTASDLGHCSHAIRIPGNAQAYEIGVIQRDDHYVLLWDFWAGGYGMTAKVGGEDAGLLQQQYAVQAGVNELRNQGYEVTTYTNESGEIVCQAMRN